MVERTIEQFDGIDILVNCAGRAIRGSALDYSEQDWDTIINVNLKGTFLCCQAVAKHMVPRRSGKIINLASIGGFIAYAGSIAYLASKGGVMGITDIAFMVKGSEPVTVEDVVDHYDHVRDLVGIEHIGVGSDAGVESNDLGSPAVLKDMLAKADPRYHVHGEHEVVAGLGGTTRMYELTAALVRRGYTDEQIRLVIGGNWARVLKEIWLS